MERPSAAKAMLAGFVGTVVMTLLMYGAPMMGMPKMDIAATLGSMLGGAMPEPGSASWWKGITIHFVNGTVIFPLIYAYALYAVLPGAPWLRGATWGVVLWVVAQTMAMPMMGMGFFSAKSPQPMMGVVGSLLTHLVYGVILGAIAGRERGAAAAVTRDRRAA